jgi:hypothetical protein
MAVPHLRAVIVATSLGFIALAAATSVRADGVIVSRPLAADIREPQQKAFILLAEGVQDLVLSVRFEGATDDFGWLVPLPSRPEMQPGEGEIFEILSRMLQKPFVVGRDPAPKSLGDGTRGGQVEVTWHDVGIYDVALVASGDGRALQSWLDDHGFALPNDGQAVLDAYARKGWVIAAIRIDPQAENETTNDDLANGVIQPIVFRFATDEPVFPLRISALGGHESEVLLYVLSERPLRPAPSPGVDWKVSLRPWQQGVSFIPHAGQIGPVGDASSYGLAVSRPSYLRDVHARFYARRDELWLTRSRATLAPGQMEDLSFQEHDAVAALASADLTTRVEAIGYLASQRTPGSSDALIQFLASHEIPPDHGIDPIKNRVPWPWFGQDLRSAAWALGELGAVRAVPELERWATCGRSFYQYEALLALQSLDPRRASDVAMSIVESGDRIAKDDHGARQLYRAAVTTLVSVGEGDMGGRVRRFADRHIEPGPVDRIVDGIVRIKAPRDLRPRVDALAIAAACGDELGTEALCRELADDAATWCAGLADGDTVSGASTINGYPRALRPLSQVAAVREFDAVDRNHRDAFQAMRRLANRPDIHDRILRRFVTADTLSVLARALFLGELSTTNRADIMALQALWTTARSDPRRVTVVFSGGHERRSCRFVAEYDLDACAVAYAAARVGRGDLVQRWWYEVPWSQPHLKGEMLAAMATSYQHLEPPEALFDAAHEYMRHIWNDRFRRLDRRRCQANQKMIQAGRWPYEEVLDCGFRRSAIESLFGWHRPTRTTELLEDVTLDPAVRYFWLHESWTWLHRSDPGRLHTILDDVEGRLRDPALQLSCGNFRERVGRRGAEARSR